MQIRRAGKTYRVTPPKLYPQWLCVFNAELKQCIFPTSSTAVRTAGLPEGQGYVSGHRSLDSLKSVTIEKVDEDELAAVKLAQAAEADESVAYYSALKYQRVRTRLSTTTTTRQRM